MSGKGGSETPEAVGAGTPRAVGAGKPKGQPSFPVAVGAGRYHVRDAKLAVDAGSLMKKARRPRTMMLTMMWSNEVPEQAGREEAMTLKRLAPSLKIGATKTVMVVEISRHPLGDGSGHICKTIRKTKRGIQSFQNNLGMASRKHKKKESLFLLKR